MAAADNSVPDEQIIRAVLAGDQSAYGELVARYKNRVFVLVARFTGSEAEMEDIAQEIFIKAYSRLSQFHGAAPFEHWLVRLATHACYDHLRRRRRRPSHVSVEALREAGIESAAAESEGHPDVDRLHAAMAKLTPKERLVLTLLELEERSLVEISELTGWSVANVKVRAFRARAALRKLMEEMNEPIER